MSKTIMELLAELETSTAELQQEVKNLTIEPNKIWLDGKLFTLWEIQH